MREQSKRVAPVGATNGEEVVGLVSDTVGRGRDAGSPRERARGGKNTRLTPSGGLAVRPRVRRDLVLKLSLAGRELFVNVRAGHVVGTAKQVEDLLWQAVVSMAFALCIGDEWARVLAVVLRGHGRVTKLEADCVY